MLVLKQFETFLFGIKYSDAHNNYHTTSTEIDDNLIINESGDYEEYFKMETIIFRKFIEEGLMKY